MKRLPSLIAVLMLWVASHAMAASPSGQDTDADAVAKELVDIMRWEQIKQTRPLYLSSADWQAHCSAFHGATWQDKCAEKRRDALAGEEKVAALLKDFDLAKEVEARGRLTFYMNIGFFEHPTPLAAAWVAALGDLLTGHEPQDGIRCAQDYPCLFVFRFDRASLRLSDIDFVAMRP